MGTKQHIWSATHQQNPPNHILLSIPIANCALSAIDWPVCVPMLIIATHKHNSRSKTRHIHNIIANLSTITKIRIIQCVSKAASHVFTYAPNRLSPRIQNNCYHLRVMTKCSCFRVRTIYFTNKYTKSNTTAYLC